MDASRFDNLPRELVEHVTAGCGDRGVAWLGDLRAVISRLESLWSVKLSEPFPGIEYNFVAPAIRDDGEQVVVKIHPPWNPIEIFDEAAYLRARDGESCVRLLAVEESSRAILLERIAPGQTLWQLFEDRKCEALGPAIDVLLKITMPMSLAPNSAPTVDGWFKNFERYRDTDFPSSYAAKAFEIYDELSKQSERVCYIHGDFHPGNVVSAAAGLYVAIDPKGVVGHLGFEIAAFLNNYHWWQETAAGIGPILADAVEQFSAAFQIPEAELRQWAYAQRVIGAWWNYTDMPDLYDGSVVKADIWQI